MFQNKEFISVELYQNILDEDDRGIIMMVVSYQLSSDRKFLKLPS